MPIDMPGCRCALVFSNLETEAYLLLNDKEYQITPLNVGRFGSLAADVIDECGIDADNALRYLKEAQNDLREDRQNEGERKTRLALSLIEQELKKCGGIR